jgi:hypothetical protein
MHYAMLNERALIVEVEEEVAGPFAMFFGAAIVVFFAWRFARTHQLYRFSLKVLRGETDDTPFEVALSREFFRRALLGTRQIQPRSFLIRALVYVVIALILLPFRGYGPDLYFVVSVLIGFYVPWCVVHSALLMRAYDTAVSGGAGA